jgi:hypothetical protein
MISRFVCVFLSLLFLSSPVWAHEEKSEHLTISHPWSRATAPSQKVGAVFMTIKTNGNSLDRLIGAQSPDAETVQIHNHTMDNGVMRMRRVDGVTIPADGEAVLAPGGFHIMLIGLKAPLFEETVIPLTLVFEKAGKVEIEAVIEAAGARQATSPNKPMMDGKPAGQHGGHSR